MAGQGQSAFEATEIELSGSASADSSRSVRRVQWSQVAEDAIRAELPADPAQSTIRFTLPQVEQDTTLTFVFSVEDSAGQIASDKTFVQVRNRLANRLPIAKIASGQTDVAASATQTRLDGCASTDPDGNIVRFRWFEDVDGTQKPLSPQACAIDVTLDRPAGTGATYRYILQVTDNQGATDTDTVTVRQGQRSGNTAPAIQSAQANPSPGKTGEEITLSVVATDADNDGLTYQWRQTSGPAVIIFDPEAANTRFLAPDQPAQLTFSVTVKDAQTSAVRENIAVAISNTAASNQPSLSQCIMNPMLAGCFTGVRNIASDNIIAAELGVSPPSDSAGVCNPPSATGMTHYYGALHEHTAFSDGALLTTPASVMQRVKSKGFSFVFTTDHSDNMGLPVPIPDPDICQRDPLACVLSDPANPLNNIDKWNVTQSMANAEGTPQFTAIRGFEWTSDRFGHANILFSTHYINAKTGPGYAVSMDTFWQWFTLPASVGGGNDGLMVFNHPGREDALHSATGGNDPAYTFNDFQYRAAADYRVVGVEVFGKGDEYDTDGKKRSWLAYALDKGWYLAPTGSEDHHEMRWGDADLPKTVIIARSNSRFDLKQAMLARRMYAVAQTYNTVRLSFDAVKDGVNQPMGSRIQTNENEIEFVVNVGTRPGTAATLLPENADIEILSKQADNSTSYSSVNARASLVSLGNGQFHFRLPVRTTRDWVFVRVRDKSKGNRLAAVSAPIWFGKGNALPVCAER